MPTPFLKPPDKDSLASNPPGFVKDVYLSFFQEYFSKQNTGDFRFTGNDVNESEIHITDAFSIEKQVIEKRPAIMVQRGPMSWANLGLDQLKELDFTTGREVHSDLLSGTMTIHCISRQGLEAERLAWIVLFALKSLKKVLQVRGLFDVGREAQIGAETSPSALVSGDTVAHTTEVPVYSPFYVQITWENEPVNVSQLSGVDVNINPIHVGSNPNDRITATSKDALGSAQKAQLGSVARRAARLNKKVIRLDNVSQKVKVVEERS